MIFVFAMHGRELSGAAAGDWSAPGQGAEGPGEPSQLAAFYGMGAPVLVTPWNGAPVPTTPGLGG